MLGYVGERLGNENEKERERVRSREREFEVHLRSLADKVEKVGVNKEEKAHIQNIN